MNLLSICVLILAIVAPGCHSKSTDDIIENFQYDLKDFQPTPEQTQVFSKFLARGFIAAFLRQLESNPAVFNGLLDFEKVPEERGFPLLPIIFPNLTKSDVCVNARNFELDLPVLGLSYFHEMLSDFQIIGLSELDDSLDIFVNNTEELPLSLAWSLSTPMLQLIGDSRFNLSLGELSVFFEAVNSLYYLEEHFFQISAKLDIMPLNGTMSFHELDISFGSDNVTWIADVILIINDLPPQEGHLDLGYLIELLEGFWEGNKGPLLNGVTQFIHNIIKDCSVIDLLTNKTDCLNLTIGFYDQDEYSFSVGDDIAILDEIVGTWFGDGLGYQECPAKEVPTTTTTTEGSTGSTTEAPTTDAVGALSPKTFSIFATTLFMYFISRVVSV